MEGKHLLIAAVILMTPASVLAVSNNSQSQGANSNSNASASSTSSNSQSSSTQTQTNNSSTDTVIQAQTEEQANIEKEVREKQPKYSPSNSKSAEHRSVVATAVQSLIQASYQIENKGLGDQVRLIAQTQSQNQDKIGQAIDNADKRSDLAKFFIGANYKELKEAKTAMEQNRTQIQALEKIMAQIEDEGDSLEIANQIIVLQNTQLELKEQLDNLTSRFSFFGWIARWHNNF